MKFFVIRGMTVAQIIVPTPSQCVYIPPVNTIPKELLMNADFVFMEHKDGTIEFFKSRAFKDFKYGFSMERVLQFIESWYNSHTFDNYKICGFEVWDLTSCSSIQEKMDEVASYIKKLREGVL